MILKAPLLPTTPITRQEVNLVEKTFKSTWEYGYKTVELVDVKREHAENRMKRALKVAERAFDTRASYGPQLHQNVIVLGSGNRGPL